MGLSPGRNYLLVKVLVECDLAADRLYEGLVLAVGEGRRAARYRVGDRVRFQPGSRRRRFWIADAPGLGFISASRVIAVDEEIPGPVGN